MIRITIPAGLVKIGNYAFNWGFNLINRDNIQIIINTEDIEEVERVRRLLPKYLQNKAISKPVSELVQKKLNAFSIFSSNAKLFNKTDKQINALIASFDGGDTQEYQECAKALFGIYYITTGNSLLQHQIQFNEVLIRYLCIHKLRTYLQAMEVSIPLNFLQGKQRVLNQKNIEILLTHTSIRKIIYQLNDSLGVLFQDQMLTNYERRLIEQRPKLLNILYELPEPIQVMLGLSDLSQPNEMQDLSCALL